MIEQRMVDSLSRVRVNFGSLTVKINDSITENDLKRQDQARSTQFDQDFASRRRTSQLGWKVHVPRNLLDRLC